MKKLYTSILSVLCAGAVLTGSAQQQPNNGGFEDWDSDSEPVGWNNMTTGELCGTCQAGSSLRVFQDNAEFRSGAASARIESTTFSPLPFVNVHINGTISTGEINAPSTTPADGFSETVRSNPSFNLPFTDNPDSLVFWAKYSITDNSDSAAVSAIIHEDVDHRDPNGISSQVVAAANITFQTGGTSEWVRISTPFVAGASINAAAYALITFTSSYQPGNGNGNATLWVDDLEFIYNSTVTSVAEQLADVVTVYPNPTNNGRVSISIGNEMKNGMITILNVMGQTVGQFSFVNENRVDLEIDQPRGFYFVNIATEKGEMTTVRVVKN